MNIEWYQSESTIKPAKICLDWSPRNVYLHRDIRQEEREDIDGQTVTMWIYEEAKLSRADYAIYAAEQNAEDISENQAATAENSDAIIEVSEDADTRITELEDAIIELANSIVEQEG